MTEGSRERTALDVLRDLLAEMDVSRLVSKTLSAPAARNALSRLIRIEDEARLLVARDEKARLRPAGGSSGPRGPRLTGDRGPGGLP